MISKFVAFIPDANINPEGANITKAYYELFGWDFENSTESNPIYDYDLAGENLRNIDNIR